MSNKSMSGYERGKVWEEIEGLYKTLGFKNAAANMREIRNYWNWENPLGPKELLRTLKLFRDKGLFSYLDYEFAEGQS